MKTPIRVYYDLTTGRVLQITGNFEDKWLIEYESAEEQIAKLTTLRELERGSFDVLEYPYGSYTQDFVECNGFWVNPATKGLEFSYPDPNEPEAPLEFRKPLSEEVEELKLAQSETDSTLLELMEIVILGGM
ncbi:hypothetical protein [Sporosarcina sp. FSL K6-3457]|uniref:hypothetical protein n=1 Tax=Sporosarcina sp. FSL K6-3457 TaxID=2978204 RepID=UPI0030FB8AA8